MKDEKRLQLGSGNGPNDYWFEYSYDATDRLKVMSRLGQALTYDYDLNSNIIARRDPIRGTTQEFLRDERNRPSRRILTLPNPAQPGAFWTQADDTYSYDALSRLSSVVRAEDNKRDAFAYNDAGELQRVDYGQELVGGVWTTTGNSRWVSYALDKAGNRDGSNGVSENGVGTAFTPNVLNQYTQTSNGSVHEIAGYDAVSYAYLGDGPLLAASSATGGSYQARYDALGRRVRTTSGTALTQTTTWYAYDGVHAIAEYNPGGTPIAYSVYGAGTDELITRNNYGTAQYYHQDRLGNVMLATGEDGSVLEQYRYDAFGAPTIKTPGGALLSQSAINNRFLFTGREWLPQFGFYEYRARAYNPRLGRFMSEDPLGFKAGDRNLFRYCGGDPVNKTDPMGLEVFGTFDLHSGLLAVTDEYKGTTLVIRAESGGKPFGAPIPEGHYDILDHPKRDFFRLESRDAKYGDDKDQETGRDKFRLHRPGRTIGCIAAKNQKQWRKMRELVRQTQTSTTDVQSKSRNPFAPPKEQITKFGELRVIDTSKEAMPNGASPPPRNEVRTLDAALLDAVVAWQLDGFTGGAGSLRPSSANTN